MKASDVNKGQFVVYKEEERDEVGRYHILGVVIGDRVNMNRIAVRSIARIYVCLPDRPFLDEPRSGGNELMCPNDFDLINDVDYFDTYCNNKNKLEENIIKYVVFKIDSIIESMTLLKEDLLNYAYIQGIKTND